MSHQTFGNSGPSQRPLSALLSQVLVAFTVEVDNELAKTMAQAGYAASGLSLVVWLNLIRFFAGGGRTVKELARLSLSPKEGLGPELGCLERWGYIVLEPSANEGTTTPKSATLQTPGQRRAGWGSGRGIRAEWFVDLTAKGRHAAASWPALVVEVERRWSARFGRETVRKLRELLPVLINRVPFDLPQGLPFDLQIPGRVTFPPKKRSHPGNAAVGGTAFPSFVCFQIGIRIQIKNLAGTERKYAAGPGRTADPRRRNYPADGRLARNQRRRLAIETVRTD